MLQKVQQNKWLRLGMGVLGGILMAAGINLIVVPQGMYSGGLYGLCQDGVGSAIELLFIQGIERMELFF